jgi:hypothetical protein
MKPNEIDCFYEHNDVFLPAKSQTCIAFVQHLDCLTIALEISFQGDVHTVFFPYTRISEVVDSLMSTLDKLNKFVDETGLVDGK